MIEFMSWIFDRIWRHMWWMAAIVLAGLVFIMSGDFSWSNLIFSLLVLVFLAATFAVLASVRRSLNTAQERKEPHCG